MRFFVAVTLACLWSEVAVGQTGQTALTAAAPASPVGDAALPRGLRCLRAAYPEQVCAIAKDELVMCSGQRFAYDDGRTKSPAERLANPDLQDMFSEPYSTSWSPPPAANEDPGRFRYEPFFAAMYGASAPEVRSHLTNVAWLAGSGGRTVRVTAVNGVDARLAAVSKALEQLPSQIRVPAAKTAGTFNFRVVLGTDRRSTHSYGIAIDVASDLADYWRWRDRGTDPPKRYRNRVPLEIVEAFEREGFIWGGRWSHYDTMHFEYRPELLQPECRSETNAPLAPPSAPPPMAASSKPIYAWPRAREAGSSLRERIPAPAGYLRVPLAAGTFGAWLRDLPLTEGRGVVHYYDGRAKPAQNLHAAVLAIDTGSRDLQQCADAVMRLRAEYLFASGKPAEICFRAVSGDAMPYEAYRRGLRPPRGRGAPWMPAEAADASWTAFRAYLDRVFGIANTASLSRELRAVSDPKNIEAGDVYIESARGGRFGHAVLVLDIAQNTAGERLFLIAQSYMPAQDLHVLLNPTHRQLGAWYQAPSDGSLQTPEWTFPSSSLRRFGDTCGSE